MPENECSEYAKNIANVNRHYNMQMFDQKTVDWFCLIQFAAVSYGVRVVALRDRLRRERAPRPVPRPQTGPVAGNPAPSNGLDMSQAGFITPGDRAARTGKIAGIGDIEFPADHDLSPRKAN